MHLVHLVRQTIAWSILSKEYLFFDLAVYIFMYTPWLLATTKFFVLSSSSVRVWSFFVSMIRAGMEGGARTFFGLSRECLLFAFICPAVESPTLPLYSPPPPTMTTAVRKEAKRTNVVPTTTNVFRDVHPFIGSERFMHRGSVQQLPKSCWP